jgi:hypothetical protein
MNKDTAIGIIGSVVLVAAMVVVFVYERNNPPAGTGDATGAENHIAMGSLSGSVNVRSSSSMTDNITAVGPTNVTFHLHWTATNGRDSMQVSVTPPTGSNVSAPASMAGDSGDLSITAHIVDGVTAWGNWTIKVDFTDASAMTLPGGVNNPTAMTDSKVSYTIDVKFA